jgi:hypothetical protein
MKSAFKSAGAIILACVGFVAIILVTFLLIDGTAIVGAKVLPILMDASGIATVLCIVVFLPLSFFRSTRIVSTWGFMMASFLFGLGVWILGLLVTYDLWGGFAVFAGMCFFGDWRRAVGYHSGCPKRNVVGSGQSLLWPRADSWQPGVGVPFSEKVRPPTGVVLKF